MSQPWAARFFESAAAHLAELRLAPEITAAQCAGPGEDEVWIRGPAWSDELWERLRRLPHAGCFHVIEQNRLRPVTGRVPVLRLPAAVWEPLNEWLRPESPRAVAAGRIPPGAIVRVVRSDAAAEPNLLQVGVAEFLRFVEQAPAIRLSHLHFALASDGRALVRGKPLPPLLGELYSETGRLAIPCGCRWDPPVSAAVLAEALAITPDALAVFSSSGDYDLIDCQHFVRVTRANVRRSCEQLAAAAAEPESSPAETVP